MSILPLAVLVFGLPIFVYCFLTFDDLVLFERERHNVAWERDDRPRTFLRRRREFGGSLRAWLATQKCSLMWPLATPSWARSDPEAARLLRRHRIFVAVWCFVVIPALALAVVLSVHAGNR